MVEANYPRNVKVVGSCFGRNGFSKVSNQQILCNIYQNSHCVTVTQLCEIKSFFNSVGIYLLKGNNRNTRKSYKILLKLTKKTPERR